MLRLRGRVLRQRFAGEHVSRYARKEARFPRVSASEVRLLGVIVFSVDVRALEHGSPGSSSDQEGAWLAGESSPWAAYRSLADG